MSQKDNSITTKMQELENLTAWFTSEDFDIIKAIKESVDYLRSNY